MRRYKLGSEATVSGRVRLRNLTAGVAAATSSFVDFVADAGYAPVGANPVPADDLTKGALWLTMKPRIAGTNIQVLVGNVPVDASQVYLNVYNAGSDEPWLSYNGPTTGPGIYQCQLTYSKANGVDETVDEWEEQWFE